MRQFFGDYDQVNIFVNKDLSIIQVLTEHKVEDSTISKVFHNFSEPPWLALRDKTRNIKEQRTGMGWKREWTAEMIRITNIVINLFSIVLIINWAHDSEYVTFIRKNLAQLTLKINYGANIELSRSDAHRSMSLRKLNLLGSQISFRHEGWYRCCYVVCRHVR